MSYLLEKIRKEYEDICVSTGDTPKYLCLGGMSYLQFFHDAYYTLSTPDVDLGEQEIQDCIEYMGMKVIRLYTDSSFVLFG